MDEVEARAREQLQPGETFRAAVWASRADGRTAVGMSRAEMSPLRFRRAEPDRPGLRRGVHGSPRSLAVRLDEHIRTVAEPRILALTDRRLMVVAKRLRSWSVRWECPRAELATVTEQDGRLRLDFTDGSAVTLLTPAAHVQPFVTDAAGS